MSSRIISQSKPLLTAGTAIVALGLAQAVSAGTPVSGNGVAPLPFAGIPTAADIVQICSLPKVAKASPVAVVLTTLAPVNTPSQVFSSDGNYVVNVTVTQKNPTRFVYEDVSPIPGFPAGIPFPPTPPNPIPGDQFRGTRGTEAVSVTSGGSTNIYCGTGVFRDTNLGPPANNASAITFWWVAGPCGLPGQISLDPVCSAYNPAGAPVTAAVVRGTQDVAGSPVNACGCTQTLQFCNTDLLGSLPAANNVVFCDFAGSQGVADFESEGLLIGHSPLCIKIGGRTVC